MSMMGYIGITAPVSAFLIMILAVVLMTVDATDNWEVTFYLQQQLGVNEEATVQPVRPPANGTRTGFGLEVVYEYPITATDPTNTSGASAPPIIGFVRGTSVAVNNTPGSTIFVVRNVVHYGQDGSTWVQEGEADFTSGKTWEFAILGGTGRFRNAYGYSVGQTVSLTRNASTSSTLGPLIVTSYDARLWFHSS